MTVTLKDIRAAAAQMEGIVEKTPATRARVLSDITGADVHVKFENLQFTASFKDRGALIKLLSLSEAEKKQGIIAMSAGNHAQGVAYHAARLGIPATIVMPKFTPFTKVTHTRGFGAHVVLAGESLAESGEVVNDIMNKEGLTLIHPYDDEKVIAGQGTVALEFLEDFPDLEALVVPIGGGGLISGTAIAAKALKPDIRIFGVQAAMYPSMYQALHALKPTSSGQTIAEGIAVKTPGKLTLPIIRDNVEDILLVDEVDIERAILLYIELEKTVAEGAGAASLAAVLAYPDRFKGLKTGLILSGGNVDTRLLTSVMARGLVRDGRVIRLTVRIPDAPGTLGRIANVIGETGGNIIEVYHNRLFGNVTAKQAALDLVIETRDREHAREIVECIRGLGLKTEVLDGLTD